MKYIAMMLVLVLLAPAVADAKGGGGGRGGGGARASSSVKASTPRSTPSTSTAPKSTPAPKPAPAPKVSSKPSSNTKTVAAPVKTTSTGKKTKGEAKVVDDTYKPKAKGGYVPPNGSQVQYVERSAGFMDYLPWIYIFSMSARENVNKQEAVVTEPDGTEKTIELEPEGVDTLYWFNWLIMIVLAGGICYGVYRLVNFMDKRKKSYV